VWNAFRLGKFALAQGDAVNVFLLGKGEVARPVSAAATSTPSTRRG